MASGDGGKGEVRVILLVCRAPGSCARGAGIRVMGVWEAAHHLRAHSRHAQVLVCLGENADETPAGRVMLQVGEDVEGGSSARRTWGQQHIGTRGRGGDTERGGEVIVRRVPHCDPCVEMIQKHKRESNWVKFGRR